MKPTLLIAICMLFISPLYAAERECTDCHEQEQLTLPFAHKKGDLQCIACHGSSNEHLTSSRNPIDISYADGTDRSQGNQACLSCHDDAERMHWPASVHQQVDLGCNDCHQVHAATDPVMNKRAGQAVCLQCHVEVKHALAMPSRHPIREAEIVCLDCHQSHGGVNGEIRQVSTNENCLSCHTEKRGPFLFEHDPVTEDCLLCHSPHGATQPDLLTARPPFLCQQCHLTSDHPSRLSNGRQLGAGDTNLIARGCMNCHSAVHGSNHPGGARLTR